MSMATTIAAIAGIILAFTTLGIGSAWEYKEGKEDTKLEE